MADTKLSAETNLGTPGLLDDLRGQRGGVDGRFQIPGIMAFTSTDVSYTTDVLANVTALTMTLPIGNFAFKARLFTTSDVAAGVKTTVGGTAVSSTIIYDTRIIDAGVIAAQGRASAIGTATGVTAVTTALVEIDGFIIVTTAGTLLIQMAQNVDTSTSTLKAGSYLEVVRPPT